jgi:hypothetical protein
LVYELIGELVYELIGELVYELIGELVWLVCDREDAVNSG